MKRKEKSCFLAQSKVKNALKDKMMGDEVKRKKLQPKITAHIRAEELKQAHFGFRPKISHHKNTKQRPLTNSITIHHAKKIYQSSS